MVDRANAFKQQYDLVEATKLKEINVYDLNYFFFILYIFTLMIFTHLDCTSQLRENNVSAHIVCFKLILFYFICSC